MTKAKSIQQMFDAIAGRYDLMNRVMTMGQDQKWRRFVVEKAGDPSGGRILDLATGTGDIAALSCELYPESLVVGGDFSLNMLLEARKRFSHEKIHWQATDANNLPYSNDTFESATFGYLLRNVEDVVGVLKEVHRVLKKGGRAVCLDTTPPKKNILYPFIQLYFKIGIPLLGRLIAKDKEAYAYLTGSTMGFHSAEDLAVAFKLAGFKEVGYKKFMLGTIAVHWGRK